MTRFTFLFCLCFLQIGIFARVAENTPLDSVVNNLAVQTFVFPQEKIYVQTDKPYYVSGEKLFFRAYLLDASMHHPVFLSRYIYVELINPKDASSLIRVQIRPENNIFSGYLQLPEELPQGHYQLRAYTRYMTNLSEDFFFTRSIYVADPRHDTAKSKAKPASVSSDFEVYFYPEGGHLIGETVSAVAFKALTSTGESIVITGELYDSRDNLINQFSTSHDGMGVIHFFARAGERYYAVCYHKNKRVKVNLPEVKNNTASLKTSWRQNKLWINVNKAENFAPSRLYLVIHTRGELVYSGEWDWKKDAVSINKTELPSGISHILLLTDDFQTVSERLIFTMNDDMAAAVVVPDKQSYQAREKVRVDFSLSKLLPTDSLSGSFSVSVFDDKDLRPDSTSNILSSILLTSDLKGAIRNPAFYLQKNEKTSETAADLLMMTHGWTRYDIPKALRGDYSYLTILPEQSQTISGTVKNGMFTKPYANAKLTLVSSDGSFFEAGEVDEFGKFAYHMELPDSTVYIFKALDKNDKSGIVELFFDEPVYPPINPKLTVSHRTSTTNDTVAKNIREYVTKADMKYVLENGMRQIDLSEVVITAKRPEDKYGSTFSNPEFDFRLTEEELRKMRLNSINGLLYSLRGVHYTGSSIRVQSPGDNYNIPPLIIMDDVPVNLEMDHQETLDLLKSINVYDIGQISVIRGARAAIFGIHGMYGVLEIYTKRGELQNNHKTILNIKKFSPLGYQKPVEFYSPKYDTAEAKKNPTADLRSVIHWQPNVLIDAEGKASFEFYTADTPSTYTVVIEGVTDTGQLIYRQAEQVISVK